MFFIKSLLVLLVVINCTSIIDADIFECTDGNSIRVNHTQGTLKLTRKFGRCAFKTKDDTLFFAFKTNNLILEANETISYLVDSKSSLINPPPHRSGWIVIGAKEPELFFDFKKTSTSTDMLVDFVQENPQIPIQGSLNDNFYLTPVAIKKVDLSVTRDTDAAVYVDVDGKQQTLITDKANETMGIPVEFNTDDTINVKISAAYSKCSNKFTDLDETTHSLQGPDLTQTNFEQGFTCANLFVNDLTDETAHYDVDFRDFVGRSNDFDKLTINGLEITDEYINTGLLSFEGKKLVVVYDSPKKSQPSKITFKLSVSSKKYGGVIRKPGQLVFPKGVTDIHYVLRPAAGQYASISLPANFKLQGVSLTVSSKHKTIATFQDNTKLPPVLALEEPNLDMSLDFAGKALEKLGNSISFASLAQSCHRIMTGSAAPTISGPIAGSCYLTPASSSVQDLNMIVHDLVPNGCVSIFSQVQDKPIFDRCSITASEFIPAFNLKLAYLSLTLPTNKTKIVTAISNSNFQAETPVDTTANVEIQSPRPYPWSDQNQNYNINAANKNFIFSLVTYDPRVGEKLTFDKIELTKEDTFKDIIKTNSTFSIAVTRSAPSNDFSSKNGYKIVGRSYEEIAIVDMSKPQFKTAENRVSTLIKLSPGPGLRLAFNISIANNKTKTDYDLSIHDAPSIQKKMEGLKNYTNLESTSDTIFISYSVNKKDAKLPILTVDYKTISCNVTNGDFICDKGTRCVPSKLLCLNPRQFYCNDRSDIQVLCTNNGPVPPPNIVNEGVGGMTVFVLCMLMLILGAVGALYGPDFLKNLDHRFRSGRYTTFTSDE